MGEREHVLRTPEIPQPVRPEIDERHTVRQPIDDKIMHGTRQQYLAAMSDRPQPRTPTQRDTEIIALVAQLRLRGMQRDPHPKLQPIGPDLRGQRTLGLQRRRHRVGRARERRHDAVALALFQRPHTTMAAHRIRQQRIMRRHSLGHRIGLRLPQPRRSLDVGQDKRHGAGGQRKHGFVRLVDAAQPIPPNERPSERQAASGSCHGRLRPVQPRRWWLLFTSKKSRSHR